MPGGIWDRVSYLNPKWNEPKVDPDERFQEAMQLIGGMVSKLSPFLKIIYLVIIFECTIIKGEFESSVRYLAEVWWPARKIVEKAIDERKQVDESERIVLMSEGVPWKEHFFHMEEEKKLTGLGMAYIILFLVVIEYRLFRTTA
uniref:Glucuronosyltransferase n=1 Tax=Heterorhabditis bacteriophora TaxID=37862 RepID=A0A1I7XG15_HETBA